MLTLLQFAALATFFAATAYVLAAPFAAYAALRAYGAPARYHSRKLTVARMLGAAPFATSVASCTASVATVAAFVAGICVLFGAPPL